MGRREEDELPDRIDFHRKRVLWNSGESIPLTYQVRNTWTQELTINSIVDEKGGVISAGGEKIMAGLVCCDLCCPRTSRDFGGAFPRNS
jgi:hypothetical protein